MRVSVAIASALAAIACLATLTSVASPAALAFGLLSQIVFILPGIAIVRAISSKDDGFLASMAFGPLIGQALGCFVLTLLWVAGARGAWLLVATPAIVSALVLPARSLKGRWRLPVAEPG